MSQQDEERRERIARLVRENAKPAKLRRKKAAPPLPTQQVRGKGNIVAGRDVIHTERVIHRDDTPLRGDEISESQAYELLRLMDEIVDIETRIKQRPRDEKAVRGAFKARFKLASYRRLPAARFDEAVSHLRQTIGRLSAARSAPSKLGSDLRKRQYAYIKINTRGLEDWLVNYLERKFDAVSIADLDDRDLKTVYSAVASKKRARKQVE